MTMKPLLLVLAAASAAQAAAPAIIPFQARLSDANGNPVDGPVTLRFRLYSTGTPTTPTDVLFEETKTVTVRQGTLTTQLGETSTLDLAPFATRDTLFVGVRVGTDTADLQPLFRLATAPWAAHANTCGNAATVGGQAETSFLRTGYVPQWSTLQGVPATFADGVDADSFAALSCADGQHPRRSGATWACAEAFTKPEADARFTRLTACYWVLNNACVAGQRCTATCNSGDHVVSGGCDASSTGPSQLMESFPGPSNGAFKNRPLGPWPFGAPANDPNVPVIDQWLCRTATGTLDIAYALCCPAR